MVTSNYAPTLTTPWILTHGPFGFCTHFDHHFHFHSWPLQITHPLWPPLPFSLVATLDYTPTLTTTSTFTHGHFGLHTTLTTNSIFTHGHFGLHTHVDHHCYFHSWPLHITNPIWPPPPFSHMATLDSAPTLTTTSSLCMATSDSTHSLTTTSHWVHAALHNLDNKFSLFCRSRGDGIIWLLDHLWLNARTIARIRCIKKRCKIEMWIISPGWNLNMVWAFVWNK